MKAEQYYHCARWFSCLSAILAYIKFYLYIKQGISFVIEVEPKPQQAAFLV